MPFCIASYAPEQGRFAMRKIMLTIIGSALFAVSTVQIAAAAGHHRAGKADRAPLSEQVRNANNAYAPSIEPDLSRYKNGAAAAPAGR
jgi:hypothetical protein